MLRCTEISQQTVEVGPFSDLPNHLGDVCFCVQQPTSDAPEPPNYLVRRALVGFSGARDTTPAMISAHEFATHFIG
jgi:hypothetical protein